MLGDQGLEFVLLPEALSFERFKPSLLVPGVDALGHSGRSYLRFMGRVQGS